MSQLAGVKRDLQVTTLSTSNEDLIAAVESRKIRVVGAIISAAGTSTIKFVSEGTATADISGVINLSAGIPVVLPLNEGGWFETAQDAKLSATTGAAAVNLTIIYLEV